jgi:thioesterase domain-containing protein
VSVAAFLEELRSRDMELWVDGDQLRCNAPAGALTPELRNHLKRHKNDILEFLRSAEALARQQRAIVPLQPSGGRTPVFAVAGHNGDVFCYRALAQHLGDGQPFFGLQPPGLDGHSEPLTRVEDLAAYFADQIRAFHPHGPSVIAGFCAGGTIAFELARQLLDRRAAVEFVALFAGPYPPWYRPLPQLRERVGHLWMRARDHTRTLAPLSWRESRRYITEHLRHRARQREANGRAVSDPILAPRHRLEKTTLSAVRRYVPGYLAGCLSLFVPNWKWLRSRNLARRWRRVAREVEEYCGPSSCEGDTMLREPAVGVIAELFTRRLAGPA